MTAAKYRIALYESEEGYSVSCLGLPGCWSQGETETEAVANIKVAIQEYLAAIAELVPDEQIREIEVPV
ncbi:MAG: type II toxin-antitoxin system HicB family antitoxin [Cyanobacteria bacterium J06626_18]